MQDSMLLAAGRVVRGHIHDAPVLAEEVPHIFVNRYHLWTFIPLGEDIEPPFRSRPPCFHGNGELQRNTILGVVLKCLATHPSD